MRRGGHHARAAGEGLGFHSALECTDLESMSIDKANEVDVGSGIAPMRVPTKSGTEIAHRCDSE